MKATNLKFFPNTWGLLTMSVKRAIIISFLTFLFAIFGFQANTQSWAPVGSGLGGIPLQISVKGLAFSTYNSELYVGGDFTTAGGVPANRIAKWDGTTWSSVVAGMDMIVLALAEYNGELYAGGAFTTAGGSPANYIAKWNGTTWSAVGTGVNSTVYSLTVYNGELYVGGYFDIAGGSPGDYIAKWNGTTWSAVGTGMNNQVSSLVSDGINLYAAGSFTVAGGSPANYVAKWNGIGWAALGTGVDADAFCLAVYNTEIYIGGSFQNAGGSPANYIAKWNGAAWSAVGTGMNGWPSALISHNGDLYTGGDFTIAGGNVVNYVAKWNGSAWSAVDNGMNTNGYVTALGTYNSELYAGGWFTMAGSNPAAHIAKLANAIPVSGFLISDTAICAGDCITFTDTSSNNPTGWSWTFEGGTPAFSGVQIPGTVCFDSPGTYSITLTATNVYGSGVVTQTVTVNPAPIPAVTGNAVVCNGQCNGLAAATASGGNAPYTYLWNNAQILSSLTGLCAGTYTVTVTDANNCTAIQTVDIAQPAEIAITASFTQTGCIISNGTATAIPGNGTTPYTYSWNNGQITSTATGLSAGTYTTIVTDATGCSKTQTVTVTAAPAPTVTAAASLNNIIIGNNTQLTATGGSVYQWTPSTGLSCITCANPIATPQQTTTYCALVTDANNCSNSACVKINVEIPCDEIFIPSAFSPNNDGKNELECVRGNCIQTFYFAVYNRMAEKMFETTDLQTCWDGTYRGKPLNTAVFVYYLKATLTNGEKIMKKGNVSLIR